MIPFDKDRALDILNNATERLTARAYIREISREFGLTPIKAKNVLKDLVDGRDVAYQDLYGSTYVMESFSKPVRITDRFFILPPDVASIAGPNDIDIRISPGISFGTGHHPTTRLCLAALDRFFFSQGVPDHLRGGKAGDIGTGSGVLAMAACLAGMSGCMAWETDLNAVCEALRNVAANGLETRVHVIHDIMRPKDLELSLVMANLRFPTLKQIASDIYSILVPGGYLILSGARAWEMDDLKKHYMTMGFSLDWEREEKMWGTLALAKKA
ncbi:50S ribosomal protein L11 methyltransferase [uncultured Desulfobacter sp.]|uniref:50S ribosomal protein L11 methyltransferase n=1 Tax=uncultured Desulfobacter sp. TaxID=240139 RepID=UPI002AAA90B4|nr:50S ribosomal protein L11 methyltransferase [uncultured Desulfobacter sp.]